MGFLNAAVLLKIGIKTTFVFETEVFDSIVSSSPLKLYVFDYRLQIMG